MCLSTIDGVMVTALVMSQASQVGGIGPHDYRNTVCW